MLKILAVAGVGASHGEQRAGTETCLLCILSCASTPFGRHSALGVLLNWRSSGRMNAVATKPVDGVTIEQHHIPGGEDVFVYVPEQGERPWAALLWVHGGGPYLGPLSMATNLAAEPRATWASWW